MYIFEPLITEVAVAHRASDAGDIEPALVR
jgi:hypothetical protein